MENKIILITVLVTNVALFSFGCAQKMDSMDTKQELTTEKSMQMLDDKMMDTKTGSDSMKDQMK
jgi:hypothetical protein